MEYVRGNLQVARVLLEKYTTTSEKSSSEAWLRLGRVYFDLGDEYFTDRQYCLAALIQSAKANPYTYGIFAHLGLWYLKCGKDRLRATQCFKKAIGYHPSDAIAGNALSEMYLANDQYAQAVLLWEISVNSSSTAAWALVRLAQHQLEQHDASAFVHLHQLIRLDPKNASYWSALGLSYNAEHKHMSAEKALVRAIALGDTSISIQCELARVEHASGKFEEALQRLDDMKQSSDEIVLLLLSECCLEYAQHLYENGEYKKAFSLLQKGINAISSLQMDLTESILKTMGDLYLYSYYTGPSGCISTSYWCTFMSKSISFYEQALTIHDSSDNHYDLGLAYLYCARAVEWSQNERPGKDYHALSISHFKKSVERNHENEYAWNALAVSSTRPMVQHFAWCQAVEIKGKLTPEVWSNLMCFYFEHGEIGKERHQVYIILVIICLIRNGKRSTSGSSIG